MRFPFTVRSRDRPLSHTTGTQTACVTDDERSALLLAARLLESGAVLDSPDLGNEGGHVNVALTLADRLRQATDDADDALQIIASLRSAAEEQAEA